MKNLITDVETMGEAPRSLKPRESDEVWDEIQNTTTEIDWDTDEML